MIGNCIVLLIDDAFRLTIDKTFSAGSKLIKMFLLELIY